MQSGTPVAHPHTMKPIVFGEPIVPTPESIYVAMGGNITVENADGSTCGPMKLIIGMTLTFRPHLVRHPPDRIGNTCQLIGLYEAELPAE
jgi:hypothetical protein